MLTLHDAEGLLMKYLGDSSRAAHSRFVAHTMAELAALMEGDRLLWQVVGLCHDLDFDETAHDRSRHGLLTAHWLADRLPRDALDAIAAHDHRTGVSCNTLLGDMLKLADVLALIDQHLGRERLKLLSNPGSERIVRDALKARPYLLVLLTQLAGKHGLSSEQLVSICEAGPPQTA
jgi:hypothetical protein